MESLLAGSMKMLHSKLCKLTKPQLQVSLCRGVLFVRLAPVWTNA